MLHLHNDNDLQLSVICLWNYIFNVIWSPPIAFTILSHFEFGTVECRINWRITIFVFRNNTTKCIQWVKLKITWFHPPSKCLPHWWCSHFMRSYSFLLFFLQRIILAEFSKSLSEQTKINTFANTFLTKITAAFVKYFYLNFQTRQYTALFQPFIND